jgi:hypothetical protein
MSMFRFTYQEDPAHGMERKDLSPGLASFSVVTAEPHVAKSGNESLKLQLAITDKFGTKGTVFDYLPAVLPWKVHQFLVAVNKQHLYKSTGELDPRVLVGAEGQCQLKEEENEWKGEIKKRVTVAKYIEYVSSRSATAKKEIMEDMEDPFKDEIPF